MSRREHSIRTTNANRSDEESEKDKSDVERTTNAALSESESDSNLLENDCWEDDSSDVGLMGNGSESPSNQSENDCEDGNSVVELAKKSAMSDSESTCISKHDPEDDISVVEVTKKVSLSESLTERLDVAASEGRVLDLTETEDGTSIWSAIEISSSDEGEDWGAADSEKEDGNASVVKLDECKMSSKANHCLGGRRSSHVAETDEERWSEASIKKKKNLQQLDLWVRGLRTILKGLKTTPGMTNDSKDKVAQRELHAALHVVSENIQRTQAFVDRNVEFISNSRRALKRVRKLNRLVRSTNRFMRTINRKTTDTHSVIIPGLRLAKLHCDKRLDKRKRKMRKRGRHMVDTSEAGEEETTARPGKKLRKVKKRQ